MNKTEVFIQTPPGADLSNVLDLAYEVLEIEEVKTIVFVFIK